MDANDDNLGDVEINALRYLKAGRWAEAAQLYELLAKAGRNFAAIQTRLKWRQQTQEQFRFSFGGEAHRQRILHFFQTEKNLPVETIETEPAAVGFIGVAAFVHALRIRGNSQIKVYEKVFGEPDAAKVSYEILLFENQDATSLSAPQFWGSHKTGEFISVFYGYAAGTSVSVEEWSATGKRLIENLWAIEPPKKLLETGSRFSSALHIIDRLYRLPVLESARSKIGDNGLEELVQTVIRNERIIAWTMERMPKFIFHRDLHAGNVLKGDDGRLFVIDWEQWSCEPIGFGWVPNLGAGHELPLPDLKRLCAARADFSGLSEQHLFLMSSLWALRLANHKRNIDVGLVWLKRLAHYSQQVAMLENGGNPTEIPDPPAKKRRATSSQSAQRFPDFVGIGVQKAGTTWLDRNLRNHPDLWLPPIKELQYFTDLYVPRFRKWTAGARAKSGGAALRRYFSKTPPSEWDYPHISVLGDIVTGPISDDWYGRIFRIAEQDQVCGEITPGYSQLPAEGIEHVAKLNPYLKVILLLRDPIERSWSGLRMSAKKKSLDSVQIEKFARHRDILERADYPGIIARWRERIPEDRFLVVFLDDIVAMPERTLETICTFLGVTYDATYFPDAAQPVHVGRGSEIPPSIYTILKNTLRPIYDQLIGMYPEIGKTWAARHYSDRIRDADANF